ncbi:MAG: chorismate lyase [Moraxella sp.]|nr:chorismate lyase [Moraxella sp.]
MHTRHAPPALAYYLHSTGSLTAHLEAIKGKPLRVKILQQALTPLSHTQKRLLGLPLHKTRLAWVREVLLFGDDGDVADDMADNMAWVRAMSVFPLTSLQGNAKRLRYLKQRPIGYVMFARTRHLSHERSFDYNQGNWGRHTVYDWHGRKLLISEIFLPAFVERLQSSQATQSVNCSI